MFNYFTTLAATALAFGLAQGNILPGDNVQNDPALVLLEKLCNAPGPSGFEGAVRTILKDEWSPLLENLQVDRMGNLIGLFPSDGDEGKPRVLIMAHMDEVGLIVSDISEEGFIFVDQLGDWMDQVLPAQEWEIMTKKGPVIGYSGVESVHIIPSGEGGKAIARKDLFIDIGAKSRDEVLASGIRIGSPITPKKSFETLFGGDRYLAKAFDDRAGLAVITEALKRLKGKKLPCILIAAATVQEEPGMRGSQALYPSVRPDIVLNLDISLPRDFPAYFAKKRWQPRLGGGPSVFVYDGSMIPEEKLVEHVIDVAKRKSIPLQYDAVEEYGQDGCCLQKAGTGASAVNLGIPVRYPHSQAGIMDRYDFNKTVDLIVELVLSLDSKKVDHITRH